MILFHIAICFVFPLPVVELVLAVGGGGSFMEQLSFCGGFCEE
jgi:hypothetical protein